MLLLVILIVWYYFRIQDPLWEERKEFRAKALKETDLVTVLSVDRFVTDETGVVVTGKKEDGNVMYVYFGDDETKTLDATDAITSEDAVQKVKEKHAQAIILRTMPGMWNEEWVWEVFYKVRTDKGMRHFYDYYRMTDGKWLETYRLAVR